MQEKKTTRDPELENDIREVMDLINKYCSKLRRLKRQRDLLIPGEESNSGVIAQGGGAFVPEDYLRS